MDAWTQHKDANTQRPEDAQSIIAAVMDIQEVTAIPVFHPVRREMESIVEVKSFQTTSKLIYLVSYCSSYS